MRRQAKVANQHDGKIRISLGSEHRDRMADRPQEKAGDPLPKAKSQGCGDRTVQDGNCSRRSAKQDRLDERPVDGCFETFEML